MEDSLLALARQDEKWKHIYPPHKPHLGLRAQDFSGTFKESKYFTNFGIMALFLKAYLYYLTDAELL